MPNDVDTSENTDDFEYWLTCLVPAGYDFVYYPSREDVEVMGAVRHWREEGLTDVTLIRAEDDGVAYRVRCGEYGNPFVPGVVLGQMIGTALNAVRTAVQLPRPGVAGAPDSAEPMSRLIADMAAPFVRGFYATRYNNTRHRSNRSASAPDCAKIAGAAS